MTGLSLEILLSIAQMQLTTKKLTIYKAAAICKSRSKLKNTKKVSISYLPIQYVKKGKCVGEAILLKKPAYICV